VLAVGLFASQARGQDATQSAHKAAIQQSLDGEVDSLLAMSLGGEDFSQFTRSGIRTFYYHLGAAAPEAIAEAKRPGGSPLAATHSPFFAPVPEPTLRTDVATMSMALLALLNAK
jgi:metal-dependent amidase/aminoacylase/carboxypeptidase family protein